VNDQQSIEDLKKRVSDLTRERDELLQRNQDLIDKNRRLDEEVKSHTRKHEIESVDKKSLRFKMVTVLFASIKGFSRLSDEDDAHKLIDDLDSFFLQIEHILKKYNIEKNSSVGDTLMLTGGLPLKNRTNPIEMILAAFEIRDELEKFQNELFGPEKRIWQIVMGIHTGPVVAQASGKKKIVYEVKGETVNIASRIEAASESGKIIISETTRELVESYFQCHFASKIPVKYMGDVSLFEAKRLLPIYSADEHGKKFNNAFLLRFQIIRYDDLEEFVLDKLERELPQYLYYHNLKHTIDVITQVEIIGTGEGISDEELLLIKTAALFHDAGQTVQSKGHENISTEIAAEILPHYGYLPEQIQKISEIIMATQLPPKPQTLLQKIICDSDLDYLGRSDFIPVSNMLFKELAEQNIVTNIDDWNIMQYKFLNIHQYFTNTANRLREVNKQTQIDRIKTLIPPEKLPKL